LEKKSKNYLELIASELLNFVLQVSEKAAVKAVECEKQELEAQLQEGKNSKENALKVSHHERA
jgi:hypothetical protein